MSDRVHVQEGRRPPFLWCSLPAMRHIRATLPKGPAMTGARNAYVALAELATERHDTNHAGFEVTRDDIADRAGTTGRRLRSHLRSLEAIGLLTITEQTTISGATHSSVFRLTEPEITVEAASARFEALKPASEQPGRNVPPGEMRQDETSGQEAPGGTFRRRADETSASRTRVKFEPQQQEDGRTEGPRAHAPEGGEEEALSELAALATVRGLDFDRESARDAIRSHPGIAHLTAAQRLRQTYGSSGPASRRKIRDLVGIFRAELDQRLPEQPRSAARGKRPASIATTGNPRIHHARPAGMERPDTQLLEAWDRFRQEAQRAVGESTWELWLEPLELAGSISPLTTDLDDREAVTRVLVLACPPGTHAWVWSSFHRLLNACAAAVLGDDVTVELLATTDRSVAA